ncbi:universal stress protein [Caballeronia sp. BR00000012568055]|uniref:universal stress protein n=1 Tax=Caballeronia sp. BR00000012568055 TaxID=2918761 RepID=UPI0023F8B7A0|nr:universal stress protein [Caballeronia sp. BR00000012568055]
MYGNIMVAMNDSESSQRVLDEALRMGDAAKTTIRLLFVADGRALSSYPVAYRETTRRQAQELLDAAQLRVRQAGLKCEIRLEETLSTVDSVVDCLLRHAASMPADLAVMGTHGRGGWMRLAKGSVAESFARRSTCPVLLTRLSTRP